jgi:membrane associated rhomboid family serine protease
VKGPRLIRPLMLLGLLVMSIVVYNWIMNPGWQSTAMGVILHLGAFLLGLGAVILDFRSMAEELRKINKRK